MFEDLVIDHTSPSGLRWSDTVSKRYAGKTVGHWGGIYGSLLEAKSAAVKLREELHGQYARF